MIHILTGEYPPDAGGVGDYSAVVASELASVHECVHVWTRGRKNLTTVEGDVSVHRMAGRFSPADLRRLGDELDTMPRPRRLLVQWTPHSFGFCSLNICLPAWLWARAKFSGDTVELMVHEPFLAFGEGSLRQNAAAVVHRLMMALLLDAASKVWIAIPAWERRLKAWSLGKRSRFEWLPVPSNLEARSNSKSVLSVHLGLAPKSQPTVGHFGSFRPDITALLTPAIESLLENKHINMLLAGSGSIEFRDKLIARRPDLARRVVATGLLPAPRLAAQLSDCDMLLQPYPDGVSTRRGSAMAALSLGLPLITNLGRLSEPFWLGSGAIYLSPSTSAGDLTESVLRLLPDCDRRYQLSKSARELYRRRFDVRHTVSALLAPSSRRMRSKMMKATA
jgi:glycosyltransferase involved in cell wall biosynthesis